MRAALTIVLGLTLVGCSGSSAMPNNAAASEALVVSVTAPPVESAPVVTATAKVRTTTEPLALANPGETVCELSAGKWSRSPAFRLRPDGDQFATVLRLDNAHVFVPKAPSIKGILMRGDVGPVELTGIAAAGELEVYANGEPMLGGFFVPDGTTPLRFSNADIGVVRLVMPTPPIELTQLAGPLDAEMTCKEASLEWGKGDFSKSIKSTESGHLVGEVIPLAIDAKGKPVTSLVPPGAEMREVTVLEKNPTAVRIAWKLRAGWVTGWVAKGAVKSGPPRAGQGWGSATGSVPVRVKPPRESKSCDRELQLGVELEKTSAIVGRIKPQTTLDLYDDDGERVTVHVREAAIRRSEGARFFVRTSDLKGCAVVAPPAPKP